MVKLVVTQNEVRVYCGAGCGFGQEVAYGFCKVLLLGRGLQMQIWPSGEGTIHPLESPLPCEERKQNGWPGSYGVWIESGDMHNRVHYTTMKAYFREQTNKTTIHTLDQWF